MKLDILGGRLGAPMTYEQFSERAHAMLAELPPYPRGQWTRLGDIEDPVTHEVNTIPVDLDYPESFAAAIETTSRRGTAWMIEVFRGTNLYVRAQAYDGRSYRIIIELGVPDDDSPAVRETIHQYMSALVGAWDPTWLKAGTAVFGKQQGIKALPVEIYVGWLTYLAPDVPIDLTMLDGTVTVVPRDGGGRYLTLHGTPAEPDLQQALLVRRALGQ